MNKFRIPRKQKKRMSTIQIGLCKYHHFKDQIVEKPMLKWVNSPNEMPYDRKD